MWKSLLARLRGTNPLRIYDSLPDLLAQARKEAERTDGDLYRIQEQLCEEYRKRGEAFRRSMPYRHLYRCPRCGRQAGEIEHFLENPAVTDETSPEHAVSVRESTLHAVRRHGEPLPEDVRRFLLRIVRENR